jgi:hypothetical protein
MYDKLGNIRNKQKVTYSSEVVNFLIELVIIMTLIGIWAWRQSCEQHPEIPQHNQDIP